MKTDYEKKHGYVCRNELRKNILEQFDQLNDRDFYAMYCLLWSLSAKQLLIDLAD